MEADRKPTLPQRLRSRRRRRGAAMVEAVATIPFFIIIFASLVYVGNLYGAKQRTLRVAKQQAWTEALRNCPGGATNNEGAGDGGADLGGGDEYQSSAGGSEVTKNFGSTSATVTGSIKADPILGGIENDLSTKTTVMCNEKAQDGNVFGALKYGWDIKTAW